jgi:hypothetical protein
MIDLVSVRKKVCNVKTRCYDMPTRRNVKQKSLFNKTWVNTDGLVKSPSIPQSRIAGGWGWNHLNSLQMAGEG